MARKLLYFVAVCVVLVIVALIALRIWTKELTAIAFVPTSEFTAGLALEPNAYANSALWFSRPGLAADNPARWQPAWQNSEGGILPVPLEDSAKFAVFYVHPTSYVNRSHWNAPWHDEEVDRITRIYLAGMASPFNQAREFWIPRYRQATFGAFLTDRPEGQMAIDLAYSDVQQAFAHFRDSLDEGTPIVIAGHSQGSLHLLRLLKAEIAGSPMADRLVAAYLTGWPISVEHDLPSIGFPACNSATQTACVISWSSFAEPADPSLLLEAYANSTAFDGQLRGDSRILCSNPINASVGGSAGAIDNVGTLVPDKNLADGRLIAGAIPARCDERGLLLIGDPPEMGSYVLPGNNYHVYDIPLFWANTQRDVGKRAQAWVATR